MKKRLVGILLCVMIIYHYLQLVVVKKQVEGGGKTVGVCMPTKIYNVGIQDGANMKKELEDAGYVVDLQYANNEIAQQVNQIENMITSE